MLKTVLLIPLFVSPLQVLNNSDSVRISKANGEVRSLALSADDRILAIGTGNEDRGEVELWDVAEKRQLKRLTGYTGSVTALAFSHDGQKLAASARTVCEVQVRGQVRPLVIWRAELRLWEIPSGKLLKIIKGKHQIDLQGLRHGYEPEEYLALSFSPDDSELALFAEKHSSQNAHYGEESPGQRWIELLHLQSFEVRIIAGGKFGSPVWLSYIGRTQLVTASCHYPWSGSIEVWDTENPRLLTKFAGHRGHVYSASNAGDRVALLAGFADNIACHILQMRGSRLQEIKKLRLGRDAQTITLSADGATVAVAGRDSVGLFDAQSEKRRVWIPIEEGFVRALRFTSDGSRLVVGSFNSVRVMNAQTGETALHMRGFSPKREDQAGLYRRRGSFKALVVQPSGNSVACGGDDGGIWLADPELSDWTLVGKHQAPVVAMDFCTENLLASCSTDGTIGLWAVASPGDSRMAQMFATGDRLTSLAYVGTTRLAFGGTAGGIGICDMSTGELRNAWSSGHGIVRALSYLATADELVSAGDDGVVRIWSPESGAQRWESRLFASPIISLALSRDECSAAALSADGTIKFLDVKARRETKWVKLRDPVTCLVFSDSGRLFAGFQDGSIRVTNDDEAAVEMKTHDGQPSALAVFRSALVAAGSNFSLAFWDLDSRHLTRTMYLPLTGH